MASLKRVKAESVRDLGILVMINNDLKQHNQTYEKNSNFSPNQVR